jgi:hypothetical protein
VGTIARILYVLRCGHSLLVFKLGLPPFHRYVAHCSLVLCWFKALANSYKEIQKKTSSHQKNKIFSYENHKHYLNANVTVTHSNDSFGWLTTCLYAYDWYNCPMSGRGKLGNAPPPPSQFRFQEFGGEKMNGKKGLIGSHVWHFNPNPSEDLSIETVKSIKNVHTFSS